LEQAVAYRRVATPLTPDAADRIGLQLRIASALNAAGRHAEGLAIVEEAVSGAISLGLPDLAATAQALAGEILIDAGHPARSVEMLDAALASGPGLLTEASRARILTNLSRALMRAGDYPRAVSVADQALGIAEDQGLILDIANAFNNKGSALGYLGRAREATLLLRGAVDAARESGHVSAEARASQNLAVQLDDLREARERLRATVGLALRIGDRSTATWAVGSARFTTYQIGDDWGPVAAADDGLADEAVLVQGIEGARLLWIEAMADLARGEPIDALLTRIDQVTATFTDDFRDWAPRILIAERDLLNGSLASARRAALTLGRDSQYEALTLPLAAHAAMWDRDPVGLREVVAAMREHRDANPQYVAMRRAAEAGLAALEGREDEASVGFRGTLSALRRIGADFAAAQLTIGIARTLGPRHPLVIEAAADARTTFTRVGARAYLGILERTAAGERSGAAPVAGSA
jgi:tetratricopeptide (TPR) repeat protein